MGHEITLQGSKICLRDWNINDLAIYEQWQNSNHKWWKNEAPFLKRKISIEEAVKKKKEEILSISHSFSRMSLVIASQKNNELIGFVNSYWRAQETNWLRIGIRIFDDSYWGQGIGYDSLVLWINYLFESKPELIRLGLTTWSGNIGMVKLAEKLGFILEARHRKARIFNNEYYDALGFGILKEEWIK